MKKVSFQNAQRVIKQILDWMQDGKSENMADRVQDYSTPGVMKNLLNEMDIIAGDNNTPSTPSITIRTGVAYDSASNRINISDESISHDAALPTHTTDDGFGSPVVTPRSTGSKNVPLTTNIKNYLWIEWLQTTDDSVFTLNRATNAKQFYKQTDGYRISVTTVNTPPSVTALTLGSVDLSGFGVVSSTTISKTGRLTSAITEYRVKIKTVKADRSDAPTSYAFDQEVFLDDHIKAVGTGSITPQNPHGTSAADIGLTDVTIEGHQRTLHNNGVIANPASVISGVCPIPTFISPGFDFVTVRKLTGSELAIVAGTNITSSDLPTDTIISFSSLDPTGSYYIYLDSVSKTVLRTTINLISFPDITKMLIASLTWTYPGVGGPTDGDISNFTDQRHFGNLATASDLLLNASVKPELRLSLKNVTEGSMEGNTGGNLTIKATDNLTVQTAGLTALTIDNTQKTTTQNSVNIAIGHAQEQGFDLIPAGSILPFAANSTPGGWLLCDGSAVSRATYSRLFSAIGVAWGPGNGSTTFNLPDFRGKTLFGKAPSGTFGSFASSGGTETHAHTVNSHTHTINAHSHSYGVLSHKHLLPIFTNSGESRSWVDQTGSSLYGFLGGQSISRNNPLSLGGNLGATTAANISKSSTPIDSTTDSTGDTSLTTNGTAPGTNSPSHVNPFAIVNYIVKI